MTRKRARSQIRNEGDWAKQTLRSPKTTAGMAAPPAGTSCPTEAGRRFPNKQDRQHTARQKQRPGGEGQRPWKRLSIQRPAGLDKPFAAVQAEGRPGRQGVTAVRTMFLFTIRHPIPSLYLL